MVSPFEGENVLRVEMIALTLGLSLAGHVRTSGQLRVLLNHNFLFDNVQD